MTQCNILLDHKASSLPCLGKKKILFFFSLLKYCVCVSGILGDLVLFV